MGPVIDKWSISEIRNILITGGCGFIDSSFAYCVVGSHSDVRITALDELTYACSSESIASISGNLVECVVGGRWD